MHHTAEYGLYIFGVEVLNVDEAERLRRSLKFRSEIHRTERFTTARGIREIHNRWVRVYCGDENWMESMGLLLV